MRNPSVDDVRKSCDRPFIETQHGLARCALKDADFAKGGDFRGVFSQSQIEKMRNNACRAPARFDRDAQMEQDDFARPAISLEDQIFQILHVVIERGPRYPPVVGDLTQCREGNPL